MTLKEEISSKNTAIVLIDHQVGTMGWVRSIEKKEMEKNAAALAKVAKVLKMPLVLTSSMEEYAQGSLMPQLKEIAPENYENRIKRGGIVNCWNDKNFSDTVRSTGRKNLIVAGVTTDVCLAPPAVSAKDEGFEIIAIADASGSPSKMADEMAIKRMENNGVLVTTTNAIIAELAKDWASEDGSKLIQIVMNDLLPE